MIGLYLLDIYVEQLMLNKDVYIDTNGAKLVVKVAFINFPPTEVNERERSLKNETIYVYGFRCGQSIHFSMPTEELVNKMKKALLKIGIFKANDTFPICHIFTHLSGCACDMAKVAIKDPTPYVFRGPFELLDPGNNFAGQLDIDITVRNLGRALVTPYVLAPKCFVFKNEPDGPEFKCQASRMSGGMDGSSPPPSAENTVREDLLDTGPAGNMMADVAAISPAAPRLALGSPPPKLPRPPLVDPTLVKKKPKKDKKKAKKKK
ncbi:uncharacterized protein LOC122716519 [Apis laboriosa]|uniref:uncharacterized protein LOC122716519 n=1 Tax=Apis laboriosa TaxID=183418 RepID=UPI001CC56948|nr:uncharacterized protein LOC122716519 [Apis laboriosa]